MTTAFDSDWTALNQAYAAIVGRLDAAETPPGGVLLAQTLVSGNLRRSLLASLPLEGVRDVLDVGTGYGAAALELAHVAPVSVIGLDTDLAVLAYADEVLAGLRSQSWLAEGAEVAFRCGNATALPLADRSVDLVTAHLLFQHLPEPQKAADEIARVLRPGGTCQLFDVDDGLSLAFPENRALARLEEAFAASQTRDGGNRQIGRELSYLLAEAGLEIVETRILESCAHGMSAPGDAERLLTAKRIIDRHEVICARGLLGPIEMGSLLREYLEAPAYPVFRAVGQVVVTARRS